MYVPKHFANHERDDLLTVMREYNFATIVADVDGEAFATHAPVGVIERAEAGEFGLVIEGHVASANPHARALDGARVLVIFHGPHTYISPTHYRSAGRVPTWNYIAVHASGIAHVIDDADAKHALLLRLIARQEPAFAERFRAFDDGLRKSLLGAITGFEIEVDRLEGKFKLGQHRLADDLPSLQASHESGGENERDIARWMKHLGHWQ